MVLILYFGNLNIFYDISNKFKFINFERNVLLRIDEIDYITWYNTFSLLLTVKGVKIIKIMIWYVFTLISEHDYFFLAHFIEIWPDKRCVD